MCTDDLTPSTAFKDATSTLSKALTEAFPQNQSTSQSSNAIPTSLKPRSFFISWNGVLCMLFHGFPRPLETLKSELNWECVKNGYKKENFGSQWAKISLAFVRDQSNNAPLTLDEFRKLRSICQECSAPFANTNSSIPVTSVSLVEYEWRSLEKISLSKEFALPAQHNEETTSSAINISSEQLVKTNKVLSEWDDEATYLKHVNLPAAPYRSAPTVSDPQQSNGLTCVTFLEVKSVPAVWQCICNLRKKVDDQFQGRYEWLKDDSLHCTIRAMDR